MYATLGGIALGAGTAILGPIALKEGLAQLARPIGVGLIGGSAVGGMGYLMFTKPAIDAFQAPAAAAE